MVREKKKTTRLEDKQASTNTLIGECVQCVVHKIQTHIVGLRRKAVHFMLPPFLANAVARIYWSGFFSRTAEIATKRKRWSKWRLNGFIHKNHCSSSPSSSIYCDLRSIQSLFLLEHKIYLSFDVSHSLRYE